MHKMNEMQYLFAHWSIRGWGGGMTWRHSIAGDMTQFYGECWFQSVFTFLLML